MAARDAPPAGTATLPLTAARLIADGSGDACDSSDDIARLIELLKGFKQTGEQLVVVDPILKLLESFPRGRPVTAVLGDTKWVHTPTHARMCSAGT